MATGDSPGDREEQVLVVEGAAITADGLAGGRFRNLVDQLGLAAARGSVLDGLRYSRSAEIPRVLGMPLN